MLLLVPSSVISEWSVVGVVLVLVGNDSSVGCGGIDGDLRP